MWSGHCVVWSGVWSSYAISTLASTVKPLKEQALNYWLIFRFSLLAVRTGLEPATPCVTGMYSNQLNYRTVLRLIMNERYVIDSFAPRPSRLAGYSNQLNYRTLDSFQSPKSGNRAANIDLFAVSPNNISEN